MNKLLQILKEYEENNPYENYYGYICVGSNGILFLGWQDKGSNNFTRLYSLVRFGSYTALEQAEINLKEILYGKRNNSKN